MEGQLCGIEAHLRLRVLPHTTTYLVPSLTPDFLGCSHDRDEVGCEDFRCALLGFGLMMDPVQLCLGPGGHRLDIGGWLKGNTCSGAEHRGIKGPQRETKVLSHESGRGEGILSIYLYNYPRVQLE